MKLGRESVQQTGRVVSVSHVLMFPGAVALEQKPRRWLEDAGDARPGGRFFLECQVQE